MALLQFSHYWRNLLWASAWTLEITSVVFACTWPGCTEIRTTCPEIEKHVRQSHLGPKKVQNDDNDDDEEEEKEKEEEEEEEEEEDEALSDHEEEFYYQEVPMNSMSSPPTMSHRDMARPPHEDPEYQKQLRLEIVKPIVTSINSVNHNNNNNNNNNNSNNNCSTTNTSIAAAIITGQQQQQQQISAVKERFFNFRISPIRPRSPATPIKSMKQSRQLNHQNMNIVTAVTATLGKTPLSSMPRRTRGDTKKCRKVYGMENREQWCTQCKWKKACNRFTANA